MNREKKSKIFLITEPEDISPVATDLLAKHGFKIAYPHENSSLNEVVGLFIRTYTTVSKQLLQRFPNLQYILRAGVGLDNIDIDECKERGIQIFNAPGSNANAVAEHIIAVIFILLRRIPHQSNRIHQHQWRDRDHIGEELKNKTLGLVGCGAIGRLVSTKLKVFDNKVIGYDPYLNAETLKEHNIIKCDFSDILTRSDILSLHLPLTPETKNMFSLNEFKKMKPTSMLINSSRGELVIENDLIEALQEGVIAGCALDVFIDEPNVNERLLKLGNVMLTPHIAGFTKEADIQIAVKAVLMRKQSSPSRLIV